MWLSSLVLLTAGCGGGPPRGLVAPTSNPQVALYSIQLPQPGSVTVQFGPDTGYGLTTSPQHTPANGNNEVNIEVAGMRGSSTYHMQALVTLANGATYEDADHSFTTGPTPVTAIPPFGHVQVSTPSGQTPQPGIELFDAIPGGEVVPGAGAPYTPGVAQAFATDTKGNVIWTYRYPGSANDIIYPIKPLPNGHFVVLISFCNCTPPFSAPNGPPPSEPAGTVNVIREVDLTGNTIRELSMSTLNQSLAAKGFRGLNLINFSHDVLPLPNGHMVLLTTMTKQYTNLAGYPGTNNVLGDVLVDVDQNYQPDWVWNSFDHLDINRHPMGFPDWTHGNALLYSADDQNLLLSQRHQNWIIKINFQNGTGTGNVIWRLGEGGDFKLVGGTDPTDWFYAQHGPNYFSPNTTGVFNLGVFDDGNDRQFPAGVTCGSTGAPPCLYSTVPELQVDEKAMTATVLFHYIAPTSLYTFFGGNADLLANGNIEADFCSAPGGAHVLNLDPTQTPAQIVWQAVTPGYDQYRAFRLPSLYPGVQW
jgi:arylsulfate sulfotransferase